MTAFATPPTPPLLLPSLSSICIGCCRCCCYYCIRMMCTFDEEYFRRHSPCVFLFVCAYRVLLCCCCCCNVYRRCVYCTVHTYFTCFPSSSLFVFCCFTVHKHSSGLCCFVLLLLFIVVIAFCVRVIIVQTFACRNSFHALQFTRKQTVINSGVIKVCWSVL